VGKEGNTVGDFVTGLVCKINGAPEDVCGFFVFGTEGGGGLRILFEGF
jgi:hypothetical protein